MSSVLIAPKNDRSIKKPKPNRVYSPAIADRYRSCSNVATVHLVPDYCLCIFQNKNLHPNHRRESYRHLLKQSRPPASPMSLARSSAVCASTILSLARPSPPSFTSGAALASSQHILRPNQLATQRLQRCVSFLPAHRVRARSVRARNRRLFLASGDAGGRPSLRGGGWRVRGGGARFSPRSEWQKLCRLRRRRRGSTRRAVNAASPCQSVRSEGSS